MQLFCLQFQLSCRLQRERWWRHPQEHLGRYVKNSRHGPKPQKQRSPCALAEAHWWFLFWSLGRTFCGKFGGNFAGFFRTHKIKAQKLWWWFQSILREKIRASKRSLVPTSFCRRATLKQYAIWPRLHGYGGGSLRGEFPHFSSMTRHGPRSR